MTEHAKTWTSCTAKSLRRILRTGLLTTAALATAAVAAQEPADEKPLAEELVVVESSVLLQTSVPPQLEDLEVAVDGLLAEAVALYSPHDIGLPTTLYFDLCKTAFSRLVHAVGMATAIAEQMLAWGPVSVVVGGPEGRVLLESSRDPVDLEAALTVVLQTPLGGCGETTPLATVARMESGLTLLAHESTAPSLLLVYGFDHREIGGDELQGLLSAYTRTGHQLASEGRTTIVLLPDEGDTKLREEEVRPLLGDPDGPPRAIDLAAVLGSVFHRKHSVPDDARVVAIATDPRNELLRELVAPGRGRVFAFPRQLEAFSRHMNNYQILFYRSRRESTGSNEAVSIEVTTRSGGIVDTAVVTRLATPTSGD